MPRKRIIKRGKSRRVVRGNKNLGCGGCRKSENNKKNKDRR